MSKSKAKSIYLKSWKILYFPGLSKMIKSTTKSSKWTKQPMFRLSPGSLGSYLPHVDFFSVWLCWVLIALHKLSLVVTSGGYSCSILSPHWGGFYCCWAVVVVQGFVALRHVESSQTRDWTNVDCIGRQILIQCTTRKALVPCFYLLFRLWIKILHTTTIVS